MHTVATNALASRAKAAVIRCAIYTRKSTEEGLEQDFNTLDAQREAAESFIRSQKNEGWVAVEKLYDDGGFTGANMDRPALKLLLADIAMGEVNCIVVYKVDRLTRSLLDFSRIMDVLDRHGATFVAVTPAVQHHLLPRSSDPEYPFVFRPVRTRNDIGTNARQNVCGTEERQVYGRQASSRIRRSAGRSGPGSQPAGGSSGE
jgi:hypothetical protein